jgi:hypothetical protein
VTGLPLDPALAVGLGGVAGVAGGAWFFHDVRRFARRSARTGTGKRGLIAGLAVRLGLLAALLGLVAYLGGQVGTLAMLAGVVLARVVVRRAS